MDKLTQLKEKISEIQAKSAVATEMKAFITLVLKVFQENKDELKTLSEEQLSVIKEAIGYIENSHNTTLEKISKLKDDFSLDKKKEIETLQSKIKELDKAINEVKSIEVKDGLDGYTPVKGEDYFTEKEVKDLKESVLNDIPELEADEIKDKLESLKGDDRLDASAIKNLPKTEGGVGSQARNLWQLHDVVLTDVADGEIIAYDADTQTWVNTTGGGGTIDGSGTTNELTYWVDSDTIGSLSTATYPSLTELSYVKGVTSSIQTQLNAKGTGSVTSVAMTVPTGLTITGSPVTTTGTLAVALDTGYVIPTQATLDGKADESGGLTQFLGNNTWKVFYSDGSGDVQELALGVDGTFLKSNGAALAPSFSVPAGTGDVTKVGTPVNNQVGVWTGDGTIEGDTDLTFDTTTNTLSTGILNSTSLTASEIVITDGSKNLVSAAVATYPSLTELTYVKGVTSAIQTQLNAKQASDTQLTSLAALSYAGNALKVVRVNAGETDFELASVSGLSWGSSISGTTADGVTLTLSNSSDDGASALKLIAGNTQANQPVLANLQLGTSGNTQGLIIQGTGSQTTGAVGTGANHLTLWGNTASNDSKVISVGNETSFTEHFSMLATGGMTTDWGVLPPNPSFGYGWNITVGNAGGINRSGLRQTWGDTQTNAGQMAYLTQVGTSGKVNGMLIRGTFGNSALYTTEGSGLVIHGNTAAQATRAISIGNAVSYTENAWIKTDGTSFLTNVSIGDVDTTITRTGAGDIAVEGNAIYRAGGTDVPVTDGGTGASTAAGARTNLLPAFASNSLKVLRVNAGETDIEYATLAGGGNVSNTGTPVDNQIAIWTNSTTIEGDTELTWDDATNTLGLGAGSTIQGADGLYMYVTGDGYPFDVTTSDGTTLNSTGGDISFSQGDATNGNARGGSADWATGNGIGSGNGGYFNFVAGNGGATGSGGSVQFYGGAGGATSGAGGGVFFIAGNATAGASNGGDVNIVAGNKSGAGTSGLLDLETESGKIRLNGALFSPQTSDTVALGSGTLMWSDLFLASGGIINFNNGNATITHSAGLLTSNVDVAVPDEVYDATAWNGSLEVPTKNAVRDKIESMAAGSGITRTVVITSGSATMGSSASTDYVYFVAGAHTMSLPAAAGNTNRYTVKNNHSAAITIDTAGAENIEGAASIDIAPEDSVDIISDGTNWYVV